MTEETIKFVEQWEARLREKAAASAPETAMVLAAQWWLIKASPLLAEREARMTDFVEALRGEVGVSDEDWQQALAAQGVTKRLLE